MQTHQEIELIVRARKTVNIIRTGILEKSVLLPAMQNSTYTVNTPLKLMHGNEVYAHTNDKNIQFSKMTS